MRTRVSNKTHARAHERDMRKNASACGHVSAPGGLSIDDLASLEHGKHLRGDSARRYWACQRSMRRKAATSVRRDVHSARSPEGRR
jgi:hypothetical protein